MKICGMVFMMLALPLVFANSKFKKKGRQLLRTLEKPGNSYCNYSH